MCMRKIKKLSALLLSGVLMLSTVACGGTSEKNGQNDTSTSKMTVEERLADSQKKMAGIKSVHMTMDMTMGMKLAIEGEETQEAAMQTTSEIDMISNPVKAKISMTMDLGDLLAAEGETENSEEAKQTLETYMEEVDGKYLMYTGAEGQWVKQEVDASSLTQYDPEESAALYLKSLSDVKEIGTEEINGENTTKIEGVVKGDAIKEILDASGIGNSLTQMTGLSQEEIDPLFKDLEDFKMTVWLNDDNYMVKVEEDMLNMLNTMMKNILKDSGQEYALTFTAFETSMIYNNFDKVEDFTIPEEAKNGTDISTTTTTE